MWRQCSRALWIREGDAHTRVFHAKASTFHRKNYIHSLTVHRVPITAQVGKVEDIFNFFELMIGKVEAREVCLNLNRLGCE